MSAPRDGRLDGAQPRDKWILAAMGALALLPYALYHAMFSRLFWFGDEYDMVDQIDRLGLWRWTWLAFAENFVPLFKVLWAGAMLASGGSYAAMIALSWLTHAVNVALLGRLMRTCGLPWSAVLPAQMVLGLTAINFETLAWSIQWSDQLAMAFMLLALERFLRPPQSLSPAAWAAASALSFSRGVVTGLVLAAASLRAGAGTPSRRAAYAAAFAVPAIGVAVLITVLFPSANTGHMEGHWGDAAVFGTWCYALNPALRLFAVESWGPRTVVILGSLKLSLVAWAVATSRGRVRTLFVALTLFDVGNVALLAVGRFHTGLPQAVSSRYQYAALISILPLAGYWLSRQWARIPTSQAPRRAILAGVLAAAAAGMCLQWPAQIGPFTVWRGTDARRAVFGASGEGGGLVPGSPGISMDRARELVAKYHLH